MLERAVGRSARVLGALCAALVAQVLGAGPAGAQQPPGPDGQGSDVFVTIAARQCPSYEAIRANLARNNIQESLRDLGLDSPYVAGQPIAPAIEDETQPDCTPITGWRFTFGSGIAGSPVLGPWGSLSVVSAPDPTDVTTLGSIPDRDAQGRPQAGTAIAGATTIELTPEQAKRAEASSRLWLQGGTPTDPVLYGVPAFADRYGFGALRCAIDNLNGDNVEWIKLPTGSRHAYCYAYYVTPPPTSGTIVIRKEVADPPLADQQFVFEGNISYTEDARFPLTVTGGRPAAATFYRAATGAADPPWTVRELVPSGWALTGLACSSAGGSVTTVDRPAAAVAIRLVAGDTVTCTFTDTLRPPPGALLLRKITTGGIGTFPFAVRPVAGGEAVRASATTTEEGIAVDAEPAPIELDAGTYTVTERLPRERGGRWRRASVNCNARRRAGAEPVEVTVTPGGGQVCTFENRFVPAGGIAVTKVTHGGVGTSGFVITSVARPHRQYVQRATTTTEGVPALARGDSTRRLPLGRYVIQETGTVSGDDRRWALDAVSCGGRLNAFGEGRIVVRLTRERPRIACRFVNVLVPPAPLPEPEPPAPPPAPDARPDLVLEKRALGASVVLGGIATFEVVVRNAGTAAAEQVVLADRPGRGGELLAARTSQGSCVVRGPLVCRLGLLEPGARATVRVRVRVVDLRGTTNLGAIGSATPDERLRNNVDAARVAVRGGGRAHCAQAASMAC